jgi:hypothetical protein
MMQMSGVRGRLPLLEILQRHSRAFAPGIPTWKRIETVSVVVYPMYLFDCGGRTTLMGTRIAGLDFWICLPLERV